MVSAAGLMGGCATEAASVAQSCPMGMSAGTRTSSRAAAASIARRRGERRGGSSPYAPKRPRVSRTATTSARALRFDICAAGVGARVRP